MQFRPFIQATVLRNDLRENVLKDFYRLGKSMHSSIEI